MVVQRRERNLSRAARNLKESIVQICCMCSDKQPGIHTKVVVRSERYGTFWVLCLYARLS